MSFRFRHDYSVIGSDQELSLIHHHQDQTPRTKRVAFHLNIDYFVLSNGLTRQNLTSYHWKIMVLKPVIITGVSPMYTWLYCTWYIKTSKKNLNMDWGYKWNSPQKKN